MKSTEHVSHQGSLRWCTPRNRDDKHCKKQKQRLLNVRREFVHFPNVCFLTMCCSPERWSTPEGNGGLCARRSTQKPPHSDCHPKPSPLKNSKVTTTSKGGMSRGRGRAAGVQVPGHVQPSTHSSLQTSWMLRLWQVVEQDLVHSLYFIPIGHLGTGKHGEKRKTWRVPLTA